jgi:hypothetical protein
MEYSSQQGVNITKVLVEKQNRNTFGVSHHIGHCMGCRILCCVGSSTILHKEYKKELHIVGVVTTGKVQKYPKCRRQVVTEPIPRLIHFNYN